MDKSLFDFIFSILTLNNQKDNILFSIKGNYLFNSAKKPAVDMAGFKNYLLLKIDIISMNESSESLLLLEVVVVFGADVFALGYVVFALG